MDYIRVARKVDGVWMVDDSFEVSRYDFEGTIDMVVKSLAEVKERAVAMGMVGDGRLDLTVNRGYYNDDYELEVTYKFDRLENDKERATREKAEAAEKDRKAKERKKAAEKRKLKADAEYAEYERLKAKFEVGETE